MMSANRDRVRKQPAGDGRHGRLSSLVRWAANGAWDARPSGPSRGPCSDDAWPAPDINFEGGTTPIAQRGRRRWVSIHRHGAPESAPCQEMGPAARFAVRGTGLAQIAPVDRGKRGHAQSVLDRWAQEESVHMVRRFSTQAQISTAAGATQGSRQQVREEAK